MQTSNLLRAHFAGAIAAVAALAAAFTLAGSVAAADPPSPQLLFDLDTTSPAPGTALYGPRSPAGLASLGGAALFVVSRVEPIGTEVWSSDGTAAGTLPLARFDGTSSLSAIRMLPNAGRIALFVVASETGGAGALWRSDGTPAGTFPLTDAGLGNGSALALPGSRVLFSSCTDAPIDSCGLWRTDGLSAGTRRLARVPVASPLVRDQGPVYFYGWSGGGTELWRSDGTEEGTRPVVPIHGWIHSLTAVGQWVFYMAGEYGNELWVSDGTAAGTRRLRATLAGCGERFGCGTGLLGGVGRILYLASSGKLWRTDLAATKVVAVAELPSLHRAIITGGRLIFTAASVGSVEIASVRPGQRHPTRLAGCPGGCPSGANGLALDALPGGRVLIASTSAAGNLELWSSDGTGAGTSRLATGGVVQDRVWDLVVRSIGSRAYAGLSLGDEHPLWVTDGTPAGTQRIADLGANDGGGYVPTLDLAFAGTRALFPAYDREVGLQLWASDGTLAGTHRLVTLESRGAGSRPRAFAGIAGGFAFRACDGESTTLWASDGMPGRAPTPLFAEREGCEPHSGESPPLAAAGRLYFTEPDAIAGPGVRQLWTSDGTPGGTAPLTAFVDRQAGEPFLLAGKVAFVVQPLAAGPAALWESDGTAGGTVERFAFPPSLFDLQSIAPIGDRLYFAAVDVGAGLQLFAADSVSGDTRRITPQGPEALDPAYGIPFYPPRFTRLGEDVFFALCARWPGPCGLMRSRGTLESTMLVVDDPSAASAYDDGPFVPFQGRLLFNGGGGLTSTDGTTAGTQEVATFFASELTVVGDRLFFVGFDEEHGSEPWVSDGSSAGTRRVADLLPGPASSYPRGLVAAAGRLWFTAADEMHGRELVVVDPATGAVTVVDLAPEAMSSSPSDLAAIGDWLLFAADDGQTGREPWLEELVR